MCEKCIAIDEKIKRYRRLGAQVSDPITNEQAKKLIEDLKVEKVALHPEASE